MRTSLRMTVVAAFLLFACDVWAQTAKEKEVQVVNTPANPVPVVGIVSVSGTSNVQIKNGTLSIQNIDEPGRIPYQQYMAAARGSTNCGFNFCSFLLPAVPTGKRLVITNFSGHLAFDGTTMAGRITLFTDDIDGAEFDVPHNPAAYHPDPISAYNPNRMAFNEKVQLFIEAGQTPLISMHTSGSLVEGWRQVFIVTGYLVDLSN